MMKPYELAISDVYGHDLQRANAYGEKPDPDRVGNKKDLERKKAVRKKNLQREIREQSVG